ncbi:diguanylate cyclase [uncultured Sphingomonas sp.]|uniref:GGDEF domain-containing protein n=1 Tax=uncultured Sphingomonas sp. TaxID=158754 RepID=UPI0025EE1DDB|nr:GGDEF domain-containing protein [uncultured Sphingomonas sp.]
MKRTDETVRGAATVSDRLYDQIGRFLDDHRLAPDPAHYAFVYTILTEPKGPLARAVASLIDGGVRLHRDDIVRLGGPTTSSRPSPAPAAPARPAAPRSLAPPPEAQTDALAEQTQSHVEAFAAALRAIQADTSEFGANLARNAAEISRGEPIGLAALARLTGEMLERVHAAEHRLDEATAEAESLREKLAEARATARRDPLTGLANRLAFNEALGQCFQAAHPCHLALCDIDAFKRINDELGHAVGDRVLLSIGNILAEEGKGHLVCRHGGEEFALLMTGLSTEEATALIERARDAVRDRRMRVRETGEPIGEITFSAGITAFRPDDTQESLFARADALLYRAKNEGRDRAFADS